ncbi:MAG: HEPN domain-containing protein [Deltaproteobacteria bacterium]|nr:HEPN domain-containing protein [Deltaproteobacteria bacterium]
MKEFQHSLMDYRLTEARESLKEAKVLLREKMSNRSVMNRLYYAMFYAVLALLQNKQVSSSKHSGIIAAFDREFVKSQIFDKRLSKALHRAFELRQKGDYMEFTTITDPDIEELMLLTTEFLVTAENYLSVK